MSKKLLTLSIVSLLSLSIYAEEAKEGKTHPCKRIKAACEAAGFKKGGHKDGNKGVMVDCIKPLSEGKSVEGVTVNSEDLAACKAKMENRKAKKLEKK